MVSVVNIRVDDVRFPTSKESHGSDAMHTSPDYSAAYVVIETSDKSLNGYGIGFTLGKGTELVAHAVDLLKPYVIGKELEDIFGNFRKFWRQLTNEHQLRWVGPEKGVTHLATAAVVNALWDLWARQEGKPLWRLLADMEPEKLVSIIDFKYLTDVMTEQDALDILKQKRAGREERIRYLESHGYPAYTTSVGWIGYSDEKIGVLCKEALKDGWTRFKMKVGADLDDDKRRATIVREEIGWDSTLMMDANQIWDVGSAIEHMTQLATFKPLWIEEPTSPDDILGHAKIARALEPLGIRVATGEQCQNRVVFKQLLEAKAIHFCQIDSCRVGGVNENLAIILLAEKLNVPICPHAGGVGLCEMVRHLSMFDFVSVSGSLENRMIEYVDHLHEHFSDPVKIKNGCYLLPTVPGFSSQMKEESVQQYSFPNGPVWTELRKSS